MLRIMPNIIINDARKNTPEIGIKVHIAILLYISYNIRFYETCPIQLLIMLRKITAEIVTKVNSNSSYYILKNPMKTAQHNY
jgi:hypothetical protein